MIIKVGDSRFIKEEIQGYDAEYIPRGSFTHGGEMAFIWLKGKEKAISVPLGQEDHKTFIERMDAIFNGPVDVTPTAQKQLNALPQT